MCYLSAPQEEKLWCPESWYKLVTIETQNKTSCFVSPEYILVPLHEKPSNYVPPQLFPCYLGGIQFFEISVPCPLLPMELITLPLYFYILLVPITMHLHFILTAWTIHAYNKFKHYLDIYNENRVSSLFPSIPVNHLVHIFPAQFLYLNIYILTKLQNCHI